MKKFLVMACIAAASMIALPAVAQMLQKRQSRL